MSHTETRAPVEAAQQSKKRRLDETELEIDINAPEPPSKKALRKAKRHQSVNNFVDTPTQEDTNVTSQHQGKPSKIKSQSTKESATVARSGFGIWIGNLTFTTTKDDLINFFIRYITDPAINEKDITRVNLPQSPPKFGKPQNKGFAYIDFSTSDIHHKALDLSETLLDGRRVLIKDARSFEGRPDKSAAEKTTEHSDGKIPGRRIFVGNLGFDTNKDDLEKHFGVCGTVTDIHMATFEDSGKCKGFAWIEFDQVSGAQAAMRGWVETTDAASQQGNGTGRTGLKRNKTWLQKMSGRKLRMEFAEDKSTRYRKRFGKDAVQANAEKGITEIDGEEESQLVPDIQAVQMPSAQQNPKTTSSLRRKPDSNQRNATPQHSRYGNETVQRLKGAIVEGKGQKMVFD